MSSRAAQLAVELTEKGSAQTAGGLDDVTASAKRMGDTVESAGKQAKNGGAAMDAAAGGADELASKGSQAAGAMAGLGDLIGGPFGGAMQAGGIGLQAMADSGDLLNAALENSIVTTARAKAGTIAKSVADKASAAATRVMTVAQRALNIAQRASPIGLIITGVLLLVGALILAYKNSAKFRAIVDAAMKVAKAAVGRVVDAFKSLGPVVKLVMSVVAKVVGTYVKVYVAAFQLGFKLAKAAWTGIQSAVSTVVRTIGDKVEALRDKLTGAWDTIKEKGRQAFQALTAPVQAIIDLVQRLLDAISHIHLPHIPGNPFDRGTSSVPLSRNGAAAGGAVYLTVNVTPATGATSRETQAAAQATMDAIDARLRAVGRTAVFTR